MTVIEEGGTYNISIRQGAPFAKTFSIEQPEGTPVPLVGYSAKAEMRKDQNSESALLATFTCAVEAEGDGTVTISLTSEDTLEIDSPGYYDVFLIADGDPGDQPLVVEGKAHLNRRVTE